ncbi:ROK family protein [Flagellimonas myxillae]|uniref:ROK family protein n=1 Tax=Flagellimonas myxillae TaxID=2942214 RepID=UPI00201E90DE|nr:ROK family protein [Muricauda myxillae]MCL6268073.1 ROK family protein [Muricauda myxillae]
MKQNFAVIGIDIGGTKVSAALFEFGGSILKQEIEPVGQKKGKQLIGKIAEMALSLISIARDNNYEVNAIGACVPGIYNPSKKTVWAPNIPEWDQIPLWDELTELIEDPSIHLIIESDRSCYILGEVWQGCAKGCSDAIFLAVGTGIGAGILSKNVIISGASGVGGAIGWLGMEPPFSEHYQSCGNFEFYASGNGLVRSAIEVMDKPVGKGSSLREITRSQLTAQDIFKAYENQDRVAIEVINKAILYWGMAVANLVSIFNPEKVIFGGGVFGPAIQFFDQILEEAKKWAQPISMQEMSLEASNLGGNAGLFGAAYLAIQEITKTTNGS